MAPEPDAIVELRRELGACLAAFRTASGLTQEQLARRVHCDRTTIVHLEKGRPRGDEKLWRALDDETGAAGVLVDGYAQVATAQLAHQQKVRDQALSVARAQVDALQHDSVRRSVTGLENSSRAVCPADLVSLVTAAAYESTKFLGWAEMSNVGDLSIEQMHSEVRRIARDYLKVPTVPLFERTRGLRDQAFGLLAGHQKPAHSRDLYSVAGWSLTVLAWMSIDLGYPEQAEDHLRTAWLCADRADENGLRAWICATHHTAARWQNDFSQAAEYAEEGLQYVHNGGTAELFLASALALDRARDGNHERARKALIRAQRAAETLDTAGDTLAGPFTCTLGRAGGFWSDVHIGLGEPAEALALADDAVKTFERTPGERRNLGSERMVRCRQVQAHILLGELNGAWESFAPVISTASEHRVKPLVHIVDSIAAMAAQSPIKAPVISDMRAAAIEFRRQPAQALLPPSSV